MLVESLDDLHGLVRPRLRKPVIAEFYDDYVSCGISEQIFKLLFGIPVELRDPIVHTYKAHVTKEKALFAYALTETHLGSVTHAQILAACVDMLWLLSLIYDDILDEDRVRSGLPSAWVKFGRKAANAAAEEGFSSVLATLGTFFGRKTAQTCKKLVEGSLASLSAHQECSLMVGEDHLQDLYYQRSAFHDRFTAIVACGNSSQEIHRAALEGLQAVNFAGQLLNDIKDIDSQQWYGRTAFSDIRLGLVSWPVNLLWESMSVEEKEEFLTLFGCGSLDGKCSKLRSLFSRHTIVQRIVSTALEHYELFLKNMYTVVAVQYQAWFESWYRYKLEQARNI